jgi:hypothetical protein
MIVLLDGVRPPFAAHYRGLIVCTMGSGAITWHNLPAAANSNRPRNPFCAW